MEERPKNQSLSSSLLWVTESKAFRTSRKVPHIGVALSRCNDMQKRMPKSWIVEGEIQIGNQRFDYEIVNDLGG